MRPYTQPKPHTRRPVTRARPEDPQLTRRNAEQLRRFEFDHAPT